MYIRDLFIWQEDLSKFLIILTKIVNFFYRKNKQTQEQFFCLHFFLKCQEIFQKAKENAREFFKLILICLCQN